LNGWTLSFLFYDNCFKMTKFPNCAWGLWLLVEDNGMDTLRVVKICWNNILVLNMNYSSSWNNCSIVGLAEQGILDVKGYRWRSSI